MASSPPKPFSHRFTVGRNPPFSSSPHGNPNAFRADVGTRTDQLAVDGSAFGPAVVVFGVGARSTNLSGMASNEGIQSTSAVYVIGVGTGGNCGVEAARAHHRKTRPRSLRS